MMAGIDIEVGPHERDVHIPALFGKMDAGPNVVTRFYAMNIAIRTPLTGIAFYIVAVDRVVKS